MRLTKVNPHTVGACVSRTQELHWLKEHKAEYAGQWVALDGDRLLASGTDGFEVYKEARRLGIGKPFVTRVEPGDKLPFGGW
jgi:hypothetical protein